MEAAKIDKTCKTFDTLQDDLDNVDPSNVGDFDSDAFKQVGKAFRKASKTAPKKVKSALVTVASLYGALAGSDNAVGALQEYGKHAKKFTKALTKFGIYYATKCASSSTATTKASNSSARDNRSGQAANTGSTATVELDGKTLEFSGSFCIGPADNFAFIGSTKDNTGSFEIQATEEKAQQRMRLVVDESALGGEISAIDVGNFHATGSAKLDDGTKIDFEVNCAE